MKRAKYFQLTKKGMAKRPPRGGKKAPVGVDRAKHRGASPEGHYTG